MMTLNDLLTVTAIAAGAVSIVALAANLIWMATQEQPAADAPKPDEVKR